LKKLVITALLTVFITNVFAADNLAVKYYKYAITYHKQNDLNKALQYYNAAIKKDKKMWQAWLGLGMCYYNMKKYRNAKLIFKYVLMIKPGEKTAEKYLDMINPKINEPVKTAEPGKKQKKLKGDIMWRSALFPGLGQFYNDELVKGYIYSLSFLASSAAVVKYTIDQQQAVDAYYNANTDFDAKYKAAQDANSRVIIPLAMLGTVWLISIVDGFMTGAEYDKIGIDMNKMNSMIEIKGDMLALNIVNYRY